MECDFCENLAQYSVAQGNIEQAACERCACQLDDSWSLSEMDISPWDYAG